MLSSDGEATHIIINEISPKGSSTVTIKKDMRDILGGVVAS